MLTELCQNEGRSVYFVVCGLRRRDGDFLQGVVDFSGFAFDLLDRDCGGHDCLELGAWSSGVIVFTAIG
jgi:hypothetical protein